MKSHVRSLLAAFLLTTMLFAGTGCFLVSADFEGDVNITVAIDERQDNIYQEIEVVDPNEYDDYRDNRDRIEEGEILGIDVTFLDVPGINAANIAYGQIDVRRNDPDRPADQLNEDWITAVGEWNGVNIARDNSFPVILTPQATGAVDDLLFGANPGAIDLRIDGRADTATVAFTAQITVRLRFTAGI